MTPPFHMQNAYTGALVCGSDHKKNAILFSTTVKPKLSRDPGKIKICNISWLIMSMKRLLMPEIPMKS